MVEPARSQFRETHNCFLVQSLEIFEYPECPTPVTHGTGHELDFQPMVAHRASTIEGLRDGQRIIDLYREISARAVHLCMAKEELHGS